MKNFTRKYKLSLYKLKYKNKPTNVCFFSTEKSILKWNLFLAKKLRNLWFFVPSINHSLTCLSVPFSKLVRKYVIFYCIYIDLFRYGLSFHSSVKYWLLTFEKERNKTLFKFFYLYSELLTYNYFYLISLKNNSNFKKELTKNIYFLTFSFKRNTFLISLTSFKRTLYFFLSTGLFLKFFKRNKAFKKNKLIKFLMIKTLRKFLILSLIKNLILIIRGLPVNLNTLITLLNSPILRLFYDPTQIDKKTQIQETEFKKKILNYIYIIFLEAKSYVKFKVKKRGRVKRKIRRKLTLLNNLID